MAGYQAVGMTHSSYPASQQTSRHFHSHHHHHLHHHHPHQQHQQGHRSPPSSPMECLTSSPPSPISASGPAASSSSSKTRSFSAVVGPSEAFHQPAELADGATRRRHSEDTSNRLRSEWVTLSKAMLMVLVEKICQLSFENEAQTTATPMMSGVEGAAQRPVVSIGASCKTNPVQPRDGSNEACDPVAPSATVGLQPLVSSAVAPSVASADDIPTVATTTSSLPPATHTPSVAHFFPPAALLVPACDPPSDPHPSDDSIAVVHSAVMVESIETNEENASTADCSGATAVPTGAEPPSACNSATGSLNRRRGSKRAHVRPARGGVSRGKRAGKTEDANVVERTEDTMRGIKMRPLRQRNCDRTTVQPWVACNKSLVYSMIDSALGAIDPAATAAGRQVAVTSSVAMETGIRSELRCRAAVGNKVVDTRVGGATNARGEDAELVRRPTAPPDAICDAPLLGALLSYDDVGVTTSARDIPILPTPPTLLRQQRPPRGSSSGKAVRRVGSSWHRTLSEEFRMPSPLCRNLAYSFSAQMVTDHHPFAAAAASPIFSAEVGNAEDLAISTPACKNVVQSGAGFSGRSSKFAHQRGSGPNNGSGNSDRVSSDLDPLPMESRRMEARAKSTDVTVQNVERPRWIALDKDEVRSLVDSLVSTMMMTSDNDVTRDSTARRRRVASPSNAVGNNDDRCSLSDDDAGHHDKDETGRRRPVVMGVDSGRHENDEDSRRLVAKESGCYDDDEATIEYGGYASVDSGRHGDGKRGRCWRVRATQCLSNDALGDYSLEPGSVASDKGGECSVARGVSEGLARNMMKWKSSMLLRLHSQSQDE